MTQQADHTNPLLITPNTMGGFKGAFYVKHRRAPTEQEIFDAGVRSGLARARAESAAETNNGMPVKTA
jgi:hypothetical protein